MSNMVMIGSIGRKASRKHLTKDKRSSELLNVTMEKKGWLQVSSAQAKKKKHGGSKEQWFVLTDGRLEIRDTVAVEPLKVIEAQHLDVIPKADDSFLLQELKEGSSYSVVLTAFSKREARTWVLTLNKVKRYHVGDMGDHSNTSMLF